MRITTCFTSATVPVHPLGSVLAAAELPPAPAAAVQPVAPIAAAAAPSPVYCRKRRRLTPELLMLISVHDAPTSGASAVDAGSTVGLLAQDVRVADMPRGLLDHVHVDPAQRHLAQPPLRHGVVESELSGGLPRLLAGAPVFRHQRRDGLVIGQLPAVVAAADVGTDLGLGPSGQHLLEPATLHPGHVLDQAGQRRLRRHTAVPGFLLGDAGYLADKHLAVEVEERF